MSKSKQLAINTIIVGISKISTALAVFIVLPIYTRHLSAAEYGFIDLVIVYGALFVPIITLRLELAIFRWLVDARGDEEKTGQIVSNVLRVIVLSILAFTILFWGVNFFLQIPYGLLVYSYLIASVISGIFLQVARGLGNIKVFALGGIVNGILSASIGGVLVAAFGMGTEGVLIGMLAGMVVSALMVLVAMRLPKYFIREKDTSLQKEMTLFSLPMIPNGLSGWAIFAGSKVIISATLGVAANGIYAVAGRFITLFSGIYDIFNVTWTESASLHINAKDRDVFFSKTINAALMLFGSAAIVFIAALPVIFPWFVAPSFNTAYAFIPLLTIGFLFDTAVRMIGALYVALRLTKQVMYTTITAAAISITGTLLLINHIGLWAPVIASFFAFATMAIFRYYDIRKRGVGITIKPTTIFTIGVGLSIVTSAYYLFEIGSWVHYIVTAAAAVFALLINKNILRLLVSLKK